MITASIVGATGYTGAVLTDILAEHPEVETAGALPRNPTSGRRVCDVFPHLRVHGQYVEYSPEPVAESDVAFVCYPHAEAHAVVAELVDAGCRVVDLSADYPAEGPRGIRARGTASIIRGPIWWLRPCLACPRRTGKRSRKARLVANPGCYPTSMLLGLLPVAGEIDGAGVIVDSKSGVSGAGRTAVREDALLRGDEDFSAYSEVGHRHTRRWCRNWQLAAGRPLPVSFTPHLLPVDRGILSTLYFRPRERPDRARTLGSRSTGRSTRTRPSWR